MPEYYFCSCKQVLTKDRVERDARALGATFPSVDTNLSPRELHYLRHPDAQSLQQLKPFEQSSFIQSVVNAVLERAIVKDRRVLQSNQDILNIFYHAEVYQPNTFSKNIKYQSWKDIYRKRIEDNIALQAPALLRESKHEIDKLSFWLIHYQCAGIINNVPHPYAKRDIYQYYCSDCLIKYLRKKIEVSCWPFQSYINEIQNMSNKELRIPLTCATKLSIFGVVVGD